MKIKVWPKISQKTLLYPTIYSYLNQNNYPLLKPYRVFWDTLLTNETTFFHFILIKI